MAQYSKQFIEQVLEQVVLEQDKEEQFKNKILFKASLYKDANPWSLTKYGYNKLIQSELYSSIYSDATMPQNKRTIRFHKFMNKTFVNAPYYASTLNIYFFDEEDIAKIKLFGSLEEMLEIDKKPF